MAIVCKVVDGSGIGGMCSAPDKKRISVEVVRGPGGGVNGGDCPPYKTDAGDGGEFVLMQKTCMGGLRFACHVERCDGALVWRGASVCWVDKNSAANRFSEAERGAVESMLHARYGDARRWAVGDDTAWEFVPLRDAREAVARLHAEQRHEEAERAGEAARDADAIADAIAAGDA